MIAVPAVDILDGACVQLVGGAFDDERIRIPDPRGIARRWAALGFSRLHVVDLDAARNAGDNAAAIDDILAAGVAATSVGGGVRTTRRVEELVGAGAAAVVVGTRAIEEPAWLEEIATRFPNRIIVAADVRERQVVTRAWTHQLPLHISEVVARCKALPLAGILVTAVHKEGQMQGPDLQLVADVVRATHHAVTASGGVSTMQDLRDLQARGAAACVIGMALYSGALKAQTVAQEFGT